MLLSYIHETFKTIFPKGLTKHTFDLITFSIILSIAACGGNKQQEPAKKVEKEVINTAKPESTNTTPNGIVAELKANREKWMTHRISNYEIEMQKICYCIPEVVRMMVFDIKEDKVDTVRYADTGENVDPQHYGDFNTIEGMFTFVEQALKKNPADISIAYDDEYGYIKELSIDFKENIADDEISIIASNMRPR